MKIAIDGPAGAGKSTAARLLAEKLGYIYIDTGAMYRALAWKALQNGTDLQNETLITALARHTNIRFEYENGTQRVICDDQDVSQFIRTPQINSIVSQVASYSSVRAIMVQKQQQLAKEQSVVMDGRDIGECVLPDAKFKFFMTADFDERVRRRQKELANQGFAVELQTLKQEMAERDKNDSQRETGALKVLPDSIVIDTSGMDIDQVVAGMMFYIKEN